MNGSATDKDEGYFPPGRSVLRRVQSERLVGLMFGQRALCIGACAPLNYIGTSEHSHAQLTPFGRLAHTGEAFEKVFFGTRQEADRVLGHVRRRHERVVGSLAEPAGPVPAGTPYSALDADLMLWTIAVMADSAQYFYELFVRRLSFAERECLWQEYLRFGELFGMPRQGAPESYDAFRRYWRSRLAGDELFLTEDARYIGYATAFEIPFPRHQQPGKALHDAIMLGSLPSRVRELYGLSYGPVQQAAFVAASTAFRSARRMTPTPLARGSCARSFAAVAATERWRIEHGKPTPQMTPEGPINIRLPAFEGRAA